MVYIGSKWHKKIIDLKMMYRDCSKVYGLNIYFLNKFNCQEELKSIYNKVLDETNLIEGVINGVFEEVEQEKDTKLRKHVKTLLYGIEGEFKRLQNDIKEMINNVG